jgi:hypothetical protein
MFSLAGIAFAATALATTAEKFKTEFKPTTSLLLM